MAGKAGLSTYRAAAGSATLVLAATTLAVTATAQQDAGRMRSSGPGQTTIQRGAPMGSRFTEPGRGMMRPGYQHDLFQGQPYGGRSSQFDNRYEYRRQFGPQAPGSQYRIGENQYRVNQGPVDPSVGRSGTTPNRPGGTRGVVPGVGAPIGGGVTRRDFAPSVVVRQVIPPVVPVNEVCYPAWASAYFSDCCASYPYYYPTYIDGITTISPYGCYYGFIPPYINETSAYYQPPVDNFMTSADEQAEGPQPAQSAGNPPAQPHSGNDQPASDSAQSVAPVAARQDTAKHSSDVVYTEPDVQAAVKDITKAWLDGNDALFARHLSNAGHVAVYQRGKYQYSLDSADYLDMTKDALRVTKTVDFQVIGVRKLEDGVYTVTALHVYQDKKDESQTVKVNYVLERDDSNYVITQVETMPDHAQN